MSFLSTHNVEDPDETHALTGGGSRSRNDSSMETLASGLDSDSTRKHQCTDVPCCLVFCVALFAFAYVWSHAIADGDARRLFHGVDYKGQLCGVDVPNAFLYWCQLAESGHGTAVLDLSNPICVAACPIDDTQALQCSSGSALSYPTHPVIGGYCMPKDSDLLSQVTKELSSHPIAQTLYKLGETMISMWPLLLLCAFAALMVCYLYIFLLRQLARPMVWGTLVVVIAICIFLGLMLLIAAMSGGLNGTPSSGDEANDAWIGLAFLLVGAIFAFYTYHEYERINHSISTMEVASECLFYMPSLLIEPVLSLVMRIAIWAFLLVGLVLLISCGSVVREGAHITFQQSGMDVVQILFYLFMFLWITEFFNALSAYVVAYVVEQWFWDEDVFKKERCVMCLGYLEAFKYHPGSLAIGGLLIGLLRPFRMILALLVQMLSTLCLNHENALTKCYNGGIGAMTKDGFNGVNLFSTNYIPSAKNARQLLYGEAVGTLTGACLIVQIGGMAIIMLVGFLLMLFQVKHLAPYAESHSSYYIDDPIIAPVLSAIISLLVGTPFLLCFGSVADTMLYCFAVDEKRKESEGGLGSYWEALLCIRNKPGSTKHGPEWFHSWIGKQKSGNDADESIRRDHSGRHSDLDGDSRSSCSVQ